MDFKKLGHDLLMRAANALKPEASSVELPGSPPSSAREPIWVGAVDHKLEVYIPVLLNNREAMSCLFDSGAVHTCLPMAYISRLGLDETNLKDGKIQTATYLTPSKSTTITFQIGSHVMENVPVIFVSGLKSPILGMSALLGCDWKMNRGVLSLYAPNTSDDGLTIPAFPGSSAKPGMPSP